MFYYMSEKITSLLLAESKPIYYLYSPVIPSKLIGEGFLIKNVVDVPNMMETMGHLQLAITWHNNRHIGEQISHWDI